MMNSEPRYSALTSSSAARLRAIAASIPTCHACPARRSVSIHNGNRPVTTSGLSSNANRCAHTASAWL